MTSRRTITFAAISAIIAAAVYANPIQPQPTGSWLLNQVAEAAEKKSQEAKAMKRQADAQTWQEWGKLYRRHAQLSINRYTPALELLALNITFCHRAANDMETSHAFEAMRFYKASAIFWEDVMTQLRRGGSLKINFPEREMLTPIPGVAGTPWEFLRVAPTAPGGPANNEECNRLYKAWKECDDEYEKLLKASPASRSTRMHNFHCVNLKYEFIRRCKP